MKLRTKRHTLMGDRVPLVALDERNHRPPKEAFELPPEPQPVKGWRAIAYADVAADVVERYVTSSGDGSSD